jgi:hypothetical protein
MKERMDERRKRGRKQLVTQMVTFKKPATNFSL